jgi:predicted ArsR family transcriptional regulator
MESLTDIQQKVYDYTRQAIREGRPFPSLRDIATRFGFQHTTARFHLKALEKKGYIRQRSQRVSDYMLAEFPPARRYPYSMNRVNRFR